MDYAVARADDLPLFITECDESQPCTRNPLGAKGCGEAGSIGAPGPVGERRPPRARRPRHHRPRDAADARADMAADREAGVGGAQPSEHDTRGRISATRPWQTTDG